MAKETFCQKIFRLYTVYVHIIPCMVFLFPLFKLYDFIIFSNFRGSRNNPVNHGRKVKDIQEQVQNWNKTGKKQGKLMCTARKSWKKMALHTFSKKELTQIQLDLNDVIEIDTVHKVLHVEPGMMMRRLTSILLPMGWTIPVLPELDTLTIGGCICGAGLETSSHKYGVFHTTCIELEVVLPDGSVVTCSETENSDLFYSIPCSYGTIGFLTAVKIPLIPASKFVRLEHIPLKSVEQVMPLLTDPKQNFIEGIVYKPDEIVVTFGNMVADNEVNRRKINYINRWYKPWYYKHMESFLSKPSTPGEPFEEYVPLVDYYHRHSRSYFWELAAILPYGNRPLIRYLFGWLYPFNFQMCRFFSNKTIWDILFVNNHVLQDFVQPVETLPATLKFIHDSVEVYPIWLCAASAVPRPGMLIPTSSHYIDIGVYGNTPKKKEFHYIETSRKMERYVLENKGFQGLYADSYLTREEFNQMFDLTLYNKVRAEYNCVEAFPDVYDKVSCQKRGL